VRIFNASILRYKMLRFNVAQKVLGKRIPGKKLNLNEKVACPICESNSPLKSFVIDPLFLSLLVKYAHDPGCVIESDGGDKPLSEKDRQIEFSLAPGVVIEPKNDMLDLLRLRQLVSPKRKLSDLSKYLKVGLPMIMSALSYDFSCVYHQEMRCT
jgi:hypothetical protein